MASWNQAIAFAGRYYHLGAYNNYRWTLRGNTFYMLARDFSFYAPSHRRTINILGYGYSRHLIQAIHFLKIPPLSQIW